MEYGDITAKRHLGNARSIEANAKVDKAWQAKRILSILTDGPKTGKEIARAMNVFYHTISGRFKALREAGKIEYTGNRIEGCNEYRIKL